jgi:hypothetical protein
MSHQLQLISIFTFIAMTDFDNTGLDCGSFEGKLFDGRYDIYLISISNQSIENTNNFSE